MQVLFLQLYHFLLVIIIFIKVYVALGPATGEDYCFNMIYCFGNVRPDSEFTFKLIIDIYSCSLYLLSFNFIPSIWLPIPQYISRISPDNLSIPSKSYPHTNSSGILKRWFPLKINCSCKLFLILWLTNSYPSR